MFFTILTNRRIPLTPNRAYLLEDNWDDWFRFETSYFLVFVDQEGAKHDIGWLKIGQFKWNKEKGKKPDLPQTFDELDERFFSLGQDDSYYEKLNNCGHELREKILLALNDLAKHPKLFEKALKEDVTTISLLRAVTETTVKGQFKRLAKGGARLSKYNFSYLAPPVAGSSAPPIKLYFNVLPESNPPTNIHVLIGRNGVGKTHLINNMINSLLEKKVTSFGKFSSPQLKIFSNLVSVTFSAFDKFEPIPESDRAKIPYSYVGLRQGGENTSPKSPDMLKEEFIESVEECSSGPKKNRWTIALEVLESDPIFKAAGFSSILLEPTKGARNKKAGALFSKLSSGHAIVLLTITKLVQTIEEGTLVLIDEPEAHLHPPLLSAFIRALSDLLIDRNGVAIIATHSPVVLQEVPKSCIWKLRRTGAISNAERLEIESFGENVGTLTSEVFGLEVTESGFHKMLVEIFEEEPTYIKAVQRFKKQLGMEARAILRVLYESQKEEED